MFQLLEYITLWFHRLCINILKTGPVPKHIGFVMDGQRRYSKKRGTTLYDSNQSGYQALRNIQRLCIEMGVREITVYAFSVYNFKRNMDDKFALFAALTNVIERVLKDDTCESFEMKYGVRFRFVGDLTLLPDRMKKLCAKTIFKMQHNNKLIVNLAFSYASRNEITHSVKCIVDGVKNRQITVDDIDEQLISDCLYTTECSEVDVIVRSSGVTRLSDFLTWQSYSASLEFINPLWPEFSIWNFAAFILHYQKHYKHIQSIRNEISHLELKGSKSNDRIENFLKSIKEFRQNELEHWANC